MERGSAPADGMASRWGIVVALVGFEPTTPPYKRVALTAGLQSHVAALPGGGRFNNESHAERSEPESLSGKNQRKCKVY